MKKKRDVLELLAAARPPALDPAPGARRRGDAATVIRKRAESLRPQSLPRRRIGFRMVVAAGALAGAVTVAGLSALGLNPAALYRAGISSWGDGGSGTAHGSGPGGGQIRAGRGDGATDGPGSQLDSSPLLAAANAIDAAPATTARYWSTRITAGSYRLVGPAKDRYTVLQRRRIEYWTPSRDGDTGVSLDQDLGTRPASPADEAAWVRDGSPHQWPGRLSWAAKPSSAIRNGMGAAWFLLGGRPVTLAQLQALPAEPDVLLKQLTAMYPDQPGNDLNSWLFNAASDMLMDLPIPAATRAATYRVLAGLPGIHDLGLVSDPLGRPGQAVAISVPGASDVYELRLVIDPASGQALARETHTFNAAGTAFKPGVLDNYLVVTFNGWTDDPLPQADNYTNPS